MALLLMAAISIVAVQAPGAAAQEEEAESAFDDLASLEGIEYAVSRSYTIDYASLFSTASPESMDDSSLPEGLFMVNAAVYRFDSDDNAKKAMELAGSEITEQGFGDIELEEIEVDDLNDETIAYTGTTDEEELGEVVNTFIMTQEDEYLYLSLGMTIGTEADGVKPVEDVVKYMMDEDAGNDDEVEFKEDGTSKGGIWDKLPAADNEIVAGLMATDQQLFPEPEGQE